MEAVITDIWITVIWIIAAVLITIILCYIFCQIYIQNVKNNILNQLIIASSGYCNSIGPINYREAVYIPQNNSIYEQKLATALLDISFATTLSNCSNIIVPNPPGFTHQLQIMGIDPSTGINSMFAYIYWNDIQAVIAFTGTFSKGEWLDDFNYPLVPATVLNGYQSGVECHKGFYSIYTAIRSELWAWFQEHLVLHLYITGHSLGGALSTICAYDFADYNPIHYSFAAPRSGNVDYANIFNTRVPQSLRINNTEDIVPTLPPATFRSYTYQQTGQNVPFTISLGSLSKDHSQAYMDYMPTCPVVAKCQM